MAKAPVRLREELAEDYRRMVYAESAKLVTEQRGKFRAKWRLKCAAVVQSLDEAGEHLFTFTNFPSSEKVVVGESVSERMVPYLPLGGAAKGLEQAQ